VSIVYTPAQHELLRSDGLFGRRCESSLLDPMRYPIEIYGGVSFAVDAANIKQRRLFVQRKPLTRARRKGSNTHELVKPFFGKSFEMVVWPPSKPALGFPLPDRAFWPLCPRPEVLPSPELRPRPRRFCFVVRENRHVTSYISEKMCSPCAGNPQRDAG